VKYSLAVANPARTRSAAKSRAVRAAFFDAIAVKREAFRRDLAHDPEKHALGPRPDGWVAVFPRDKREAFARRSCSNKKIERDDDSKKSHPALGAQNLVGMA